MSTLRNPFQEWLKGKQPLPERFYVENASDIVNVEWNCWVTPSRRAKLHEAGALNWLSLKQSRAQTKAYLEAASKIVQGLSGAWLDGWEREEMANSGLTPPSLCYPIYLITCEDAVSERVVYVGKTSASNRFSGGHAAALKLHAPEYKGFDKWIYQCSICLSYTDEYLFLEWLDPLSTAEAVLDDLESQLIYDLQPELNTAKRKRHAAKHPLVIHLQKDLPESRLDDQFFFPPAVGRR